MRRWGLGLVAITGLLLAVGLVLHKDTPPTPTPSPLPAASAKPGAWTGRLTTAPSPLRGGSLRIRGVVRDDHGPVARVRISASRPEAGQTLSKLPCPQAARGEPLIPECVPEATPLILELVSAREGEAPVYAEVLSAEDGTFSLDGLPGGSFTLWALGEHGAVMRPGVPAGADGVELYLAPGFTLEGSVVGGKSPLPDAQVTVIHPEHTRFFDARTTPDGLFRIGPLPGSDYLLAVSAEGWLPQLFSSQNLRWPGARLELSRPLRITGRVLSGSAPTPGVEVRLEESPRSDVRLARTDAQGRFTFEPLPPGGYRLTAEESGRFALATLELEEAPPPEIVLNLGEALFVEGRVLDEANHLVSDAHVEAMPSEALPWPQRTRTDPEGRYRLGPLAPGPYQFVARARRHLKSFTEETVKAGSGPVDITLERAASIEGIVVDREGQPLAGIALSLRLPGRMNPRHPYAAFDESDEDGHFLLDVASPGLWLLETRAASVLFEQLQVEAPSEGVRLIVRRGGSVSGTFMDPQGLPLPTGQVALWNVVEPGIAEETGEVDEAGRFKLLGVKPGRYMLEATFSADCVERSATMPVELKGEEQVEVSLRLETGHTLSGVVVDRAGQPLAGAVVQASQVVVPPWRKVPEGAIWMGDVDGPRGVNSGPDGRFTLRHLEAKAYELEAFKEGYRTAPGTAPLRVSPSSPEARLVLEPLGYIRGRLVGPTGEPITEFHVNDEPRENASGAFSIPILETGVERIDLAVEGMAPMVRTVQVREGIDVDLGELRVGTGRRIRGRVVDAETSAPISAGIHAADRSVDSLPTHSRHWRFVRTEQDGTFELTNVEARPLTLEVSAEGHRQQRVSLDDRTEEVTVRLDLGAQVELHVRDANGQPLGAELDLDRDEGGGRKSFTQDGNRVLSGLEPGHYTVRVSPLHSAPRTAFFRPQRLRVPASGRVSLTLTAEPGGATLLVTVKADKVRSVWLRPGGAPTLVSDDDLDRALEGSMLPELPADDSMRFPHLPPGRATLLMVSDENKVRVHSQELDLPAEGTLSLEVSPAWQPLAEDTE